MYSDATTIDTKTVPGAVGVGRAHAKTILLGEHSAVYGGPAIVVPLPELEVRATARFADEMDLSQDQPVSGIQAALRDAQRRWGAVGDRIDIMVDSDIPSGRGLGFSAAAVAAAVEAVADLYGRSLDSDTRYDLVQTAEQHTHGRASGVDACGVLASRPLWFRSGAARPVVSRLDAVLVIADTGVTGSTRDAVDIVRGKLEQDPMRVRTLLTRAAALTSAAANDLAAGHAAALGRKLVEFQWLLTGLGVTGVELDRLISVAMAAGALGAKLTGGGLGGCVLALAEDDRAARVQEALVGAGATMVSTVMTRTWLP